MAQQRYFKLTITDNVTNPVSFHKAHSAREVLASAGIELTKVERAKANHDYTDYYGNTVRYETLTKEAYEASLRIAEITAEIDAEYEQRNGLSEEQYAEQQAQETADANTSATLATINNEESDYQRGYGFAEDLIGDGTGLTFAESELTDEPLMQQHSESFLNGYRAAIAEYREGFAAGLAGEQLTAEDNRSQRYLDGYANGAAEREHAVSGSNVRELAEQDAQDFIAQHSAQAANDYSENILDGLDGETCAADIREYWERYAEIASEAAAQDYAAQSNQEIRVEVAFEAAKQATTAEELTEEAAFFGDLALAELRAPEGNIDSAVALAITAAHYAGLVLEFRAGYADGESRLGVNDASAAAAAAAAEYYATQTTLFPEIVGSKYWKGFRAAVDERDASAIARAEKALIEREEKAAQEQAKISYDKGYAAGQKEAADYGLQEAENFYALVTGDDSSMHSGGTYEKVWQGFRAALDDARRESGSSSERCEKQQQQQRKTLYSSAPPPRGRKQGRKMLFGVRQTATAR